MSFYFCSDMLDIQLKFDAIDMANANSSLTTK